MDDYPWSQNNHVLYHGVDHGYAHVDEIDHDFTRAIRLYLLSIYNRVFRFS